MTGALILVAVGAALAAAALAILVTRRREGSIRYIWVLGAAQIYLTGVGMSVLAFALILMQHLPAQEKARLLIDLAVLLLFLLLIWFGSRPVTLLEFVPAAGLAELAPAERLQRIADAARGFAEEAAAAAVAAQNSANAAGDARRVAEELMRQEADAHAQEEEQRRGQGE